MRLLIFTQAVDQGDPVLGFFHRWVEELARQYESIEVVCLQEGRHALPQNVRVHSLGKERGRSRIKYVKRFYQYLWSLRKEYDAVFVHMNQEYVLLGGVPWWLLGKRVYLWRNTYAGSVFTDSAVWWCTKVFCTSCSAYIAKYKKAEFMPVGIDTDFFSPGAATAPGGSILSLGRVAPSKHLEILIEALGILAGRGMTYTADIVGDALPEDAPRFQTLKARVEELGIRNRVTFRPGIANDDAPPVYRAHEVFVNLSPSGMYDKTIFEASAAGCLVLASSGDFAQAADPRCVFPERDASTLAARLEALLALPEEEKQKLREQLRARAVAEHSLTALGARLAAAIH